MLPNGPVVLLRPDGVSPVAEVQIWARVGSADERPGEEGLAHFHEHMLFKGTARRGVGEVAGEIEGVGGRINAYTSYDMTVYHATVPAAETATAVDVLGDAIRSSLFDPAEIAREVEVVLEEIRRAEDSPGQVLGQAVFTEAYRVHPYRAPILGTPESVSHFDRARVRGFFERWYTPDDLLVVVAGDFDPAQALDAVRAAFAGAVPGAPSRARQPEPPRSAPRAAVLRRPFERASFELAYGAPGFLHPDTPRLDLLASILGEGDSSRLVRRVKEEEELADRVDATSYTPLDPGLFSASVDVDAPRLERAVEAVAREVERLRLEPVSRDELERARASFLAALAFERESVSGLARKIGSFELLAGDHRYEERYLEAIRTATPGALLEAARAHLAPDGVTAVALLPRNDMPAFDAGALAAAARRGVDAIRARFTPPAPLPRAESTAPREARAPARRSAPHLHGYRLPNGAALHVLPRREVPVVAVRAAFLGGLLSEREDTSGLTGFLTSTWLRGTQQRSAADFARSVEDLAAEIDGYAGRSSFGLTLEVPSAQLDPALELFAEVLLRPGFDGKEIEHERRDTLAAITRREDRLAERAFDLFLHALYPTHPYRFPVLGTKPSVRRIDRVALESHHSHYVRASNCVLAVAGDVEPDAVAARLAALLADLPSGPFARPAPAHDEPPREARQVALKKRREQAHLVIGFPGLTLHDEDRHALELVSQILAGQGGRLFLELRDRRSLAYSVTAMNVEGVDPGYFAVYIGTAPEKLEQAKQGMLEELERIVTSAPTEDELRRAQHYLAGNFAIDLQRAATRAAHVAQDALFGLGPEAHLRYAEEIHAVTKDDVLRVAQRVIDLAAYVLAVVKP